MDTCPGIMGRCSTIKLLSLARGLWRYFGPIG